MSTQAIDKDSSARELANHHWNSERSMVKVVRYRGQNEENPSDPIKLLLVNSDTIPAGIVPISFGPDEDSPFPLVLIEVTQEEYDRIDQGEWSLPTDWRDPETLFPHSDRIR